MTAPPQTWATRIVLNTPNADGDLIEIDVDLRYLQTPDQTGISFAAPGPRTDGGATHYYVPWTSIAYAELDTAAEVQA